jgi:hypothetical protein
MNHLTADQTLLDRLAGVMEPVEIRDPSRKVLGWFTPVFADEGDKDERAAKYFDLAEAEPNMANGDRGSSLAEIWKRVRAGENPG